MSWSPLPDGADIAIAPGFTYAIVASVSKNFSKAQILSKVPAGVEVVDYAEQGERPGLGPDPNSDHRYVAVEVFSRSFTGNLPWKSPWPTTIYELVHAWGASGGSQPLPIAPATTMPVWPWVVGVFGLGGLAYWWWRAHRAGSW